MAESYSQLEVANSEHVQPFPEVVRYSTLAPELSSPSYEAPEAVQKEPYLPPHALSHESPELAVKQWRPEVGVNFPVLRVQTDRQQQSSVPIDPSTFVAQDLMPADGNFAPQTKGAQPGKEVAPDEDPAKKGFLQHRGILFRVCVGLIVLPIIVIGVGVGVGIGLKNRRATSPR